MDGNANSTWEKRRLQKFAMNLTNSNKLWKKLQAFEKRKVYKASNQEIGFIYES
jgi:hypothetical protein